MPAATGTRRDFLRDAAFVAAGGTSGLLVPHGPLLTPAAHAAGRDPVSMAMHIHASFSEGTGSMEAHLEQATRHGIDVIWWSEHDYRMSAHGYRRAVHFNGFTEYEAGEKWTWTKANKGSFSSSAGAIVARPVSPGDPDPSGALYLAARSAGSGAATRGYAGAARNGLIRTSLAGTTIKIDVHPVAVGRDAYLSVTVVTSYRPSRAGRPRGVYTLSYRVGGRRKPGTRVADGTTGIVTLDAPRGQWTTLRLRPARDLAAIWPGVIGRDASLYAISVGVTSRERARAEAYVDYLRFRRRGRSGDEPLETQRKIMAAYATSFPRVRQYQSLEVSLIRPHVGWYGGKVSLPDYGGQPPTPDTSTSAAKARIDAIHAAGGLASYNHPFGSGHGAALSESAQESARRSVAKSLISTRAMGCDLLEVGYRLRAGVTLARHASVWDACSRNGIFLTGNGVTDDHGGRSWLSQKLNFVTWAWAASAAKSDLVAALRAGRVYFGDPARYRGRLDLRVDGSAPMGSVTVSSASSRSLRIIATDVPGSGSVVVVRGVVDYAGPTKPDPIITTSTLKASAFSTGAREVSVDTRTSCFVRVVVRNSSGVIVALSNPVWLLRKKPPGGIPPARRA